MIVSQKELEANHRHRMLTKTESAAFANEIVCGTNCSPMESEIIVETAKKAFGIGQWGEGRPLSDGQVVFVAVAIEAPAGCPLTECPQARLVLTLISRRADIEVRYRHGASAMRRQQIVRMTEEALDQGGVLTQEDLAMLLGCDVRTVRSDIKVLRNQQIVVKTRGTVKDIGPGVSHREQAVRLWLSGKEPLDVAHHLKHSLGSIERYIRTFCRVVYAYKKLQDHLKTALVVGISHSLALRYWDLHCELIYKNSFYRDRLDEVLGLGEGHWDAVDGKKKLSPTARQSRSRRGEP